VIKRCAKHSIDVGLEALIKHKKSGQQLTRAVIAEVCGCSSTVIMQIEQRAIRKLQHNPLLHDYFNQQ